jgi:hypothetical protein
VAAGLGPAADRFRASAGLDGVQARSDHPEVLWLAGLMEAGQASEIEAMRNLLADLDRA